MKKLNKAGNQNRQSSRQNPSDTALKAMLDRPEGERPSDSELFMLADLIKPCFSKDRDFGDVGAVFESIHDLVKENPRVKPVAEALLQFARAEDFLSCFVARVAKI